MMRLASIIIIVILTALSPALAQKRVQLQKGAGKLIGGVRNGERIERVIDNVVFVQNTTTIYCDSAWFYRSKNMVEAFGRVKIVEGDSITITAGHLEYDGNTKRAKLRNSVVFTKLEQAKLFTDFLDYDRTINEARYYKGGRLVDSINTLVSERGYYDATLNLASFKKDVKVTNPDYTMSSDSMQYNSKSKIIYFVSETSVVDKDTNTFNYQSGKYNTIERTFYSKKGSGRSQNFTIDGDHFDFDDLKKVYKTRGNVVMKSLEDNIIIYGQSVDTYKNKNLAKVYNNAYVAKATDDGDTLFITADTLVSIDNVDPAKKRVLAYRNVKIFKSDFQGIADSLEYRSSDSTLYFYKDPVLWTDENQMTADSVRVLIERKNISKIYLVGKAFVVSKDTLLNYNQIKGRTMTAEFGNGQLKRVNVQGNGESLYFALDEKTHTLTGMNKIICSNIIIRFLDGKVNNLSFYVKPDANFIPPHELTKEATELDGFTWKEPLRPIRKDVVKETQPQEEPPVNKPERHARKRLKD